VRSSCRSPLKKQRRRALGAVLGIGVATLLMAGVAIADSGPPLLVSGVDPYAACTVGAPGFNYPSAEAEPFVAVNPANSDNIVGVFQQDRWNNGAARGLAAAVSFDGGQSWATVTLPFSTCAGGLGYSRASDPWISFGPDGTAYATSISVDLTTGRSAVAAAVSHDGGSTWGDVHRLRADTNGKILNDKESVTADPVHPGVAYVMWDRFNAGRNNQPTYFSRTTDFGKTWSRPRRLTSNGRSQGSIGEIIVVDPRTDTLYDIYDALLFGSYEQTTGTEKVMVSHDQGASWSRPRAIAADRDVSAADPVTGAPLRTGSGLPDAAIDPKTGELYVVWEDSRFSRYRYDEVALSRSKNGGRTWSRPIRVNKDTGLPAVTPMVAVNADGVVGVSYFDFRTSPTADPSTLPTSYWLTTSSPGGKSFTAERPIVNTPFDLLSAPFAYGYFLGDYQGLAADGTSFVSFFVQATGTETSAGDPANRTDVYFNSLQPGAAPVSARHTPR
jgi:hypothetical protein